MIPCGAILGAVTGGILGFAHRNQNQSGAAIFALRDGIILGFIGIVLGTWMGLAYGREWGGAPTPMAVMAFWFMFGIPAAIIGAIIGVIWRLVQS